jgi:hypothetical protein
MSARRAGRSPIDCDLTENARSAASCFGKRLSRIKGKAKKSEGYEHAESDFDFDVGGHCVGGIGDAWWMPEADWQGRHLRHVTRKAVI